MYINSARINNRYFVYSKEKYPDVPTVNPETVSKSQVYK